MKEDNELTEHSGVDTKEEVIANQSKITSMLASYQFEKQKKNSNWNDFIFNWNSLTNEKTEIIKDTRIFRWLYPIKFNIDLAIIIEAIQRNIQIILESRAKGLELIYSTLNIDKEKFYEKIEEIQNLLIDFGKVKVCSNGTVILVNESCEKFFNRRIKNENKEVYI